MDDLKINNASRNYLVIQAHEDLIKLQHDYDIKTQEANDNALVAEMYRQKLLLANTSECVTLSEPD